MAKFEVCKVQNKNFAHWRSNTEDNISHPYEWISGSNGFGASGFSAATYVGNTCISVETGTGELSQYEIVQNNSQIYTLKLDYASISAGSPTANYTIKQYDTNGDLLVETNFTTDTLTSSWATTTKTLGPAGSDLVFNANTTLIEIIVERGGYTYYCTKVRLLGRSFTLNKGFDLPVDTAPIIVQKSSETVSGDLLAASYYHQPLAQVIVKVSRMRKTDENNFRNFLQDVDVMYLAGTFLFTDDDGNEYFGQFIQGASRFTSTGYPSVNTTFTFQEVS